MIFPKASTFFFYAITQLLTLLLVLFLPTSVFAATPAHTFATLNDSPSPSPVPIIPYSSAAEKMLSVIQNPAPIKKTTTLNSCYFTPFTWTGKASYYTWDGCMGCNSERQ